MNKENILHISAVFAVIAGIILVIGGTWGIYFTYLNISQENIVTPSDASVAEKPVRGVFTLKAQIDIIREHTLRMTGGKTYSEMPRLIPRLDTEGQPVLDTEGRPSLVPNTARDIWITATTLITALNLAIFAYVFSMLIILFGFVSMWTGIVFYILSRK